MSSSTVLHRQQHGGQEQASSSSEPVNGGDTEAVTIPGDSVAIDSEFISQQFRIPLYLFLNAVSSIGIVFANKVVFQVYEFRYGTLLTLLHFIVTFLGLEICRRFGMFERKANLKIKEVIPLSASFCGFVVLTNLSLLFNTVGFYQLIKVLTTPLIVIIQTLFYGESFPTNIKLSLTVVCIGVTIASVTDPEANLLGSFIALSALLVTSQYQIWVGTKQKELDCSSYQLLYYQAPLSALMLIPLVPIFDDVLSIREPPSVAAVTAILISCLLAFLVNISIFLVIGKTSPITYNVLGHFKLTVILIGGFVFFGQSLDLKNISGILITLAGVFWYTHLKQQGTAVKK